MFETIIVFKRLKRNRGPVSVIRVSRFLLEFQLVLMTQNENKRNNGVQNAFMTRPGNMIVYKSLLAL